MIAVDTPTMTKLIMTCFNLSTDGRLGDRQHRDFLVAGKRLLYRPLTGTTEVASVGIARATKGDVTPAGEKFCEILRKNSSAVVLQ